MYKVSSNITEPALTSPDTPAPVTADSPQAFNPHVKGYTRPHVVEDEELFRLLLADEFHQLHDRSGNPVWIPKRTADDISAFAESLKFSAFWPRPFRHGFTFDHIRRAVNAYLDRHGMRTRFKVEQIGDIDAVEIVPLPGKRRLPALDIRAIRRAREASQACNDESRLPQLFDELARLQAKRDGKAPLTYGRRGSYKRREGDKYGWSRMSPGDVTLLSSATKAQIRAHYARWCWVRGLPYVSPRMVVMDDGRIAVEAPQNVGDVPWSVRWSDGRTRPPLATDDNKPLGLLDDEDLATLAYNIDQVHATQGLTG